MGGYINPAFNVGVSFFFFFFYKSVYLQPCKDTYKPVLRKHCGWNAEEKLPISKNRKKSIDSRIDSSRTI